MYMSACNFSILSKQLGKKSLKIKIKHEIAFVQFLCFWTKNLAIPVLDFFQSEYMEFLAFFKKEGIQGKLLPKYIVSSKCMCIYCTALLKNSTIMYVLISSSGNTYEAFISVNCEKMIFFI